MSRYFKLRGQIYYHELKRMLASVSQLFTFLMMILYLAIPASVLTALVSLSVIADTDTPTDQRILYQWGYFILVYVMLSIQKNAILAQSYRPYMASLLIPAGQKHSATFLLTLAAGNLPLLAPVFLLGYIPDWQTFTTQLHFPLFALSVLVIAWISLKNKAFPWLTLCLAPLLLHVGSSHYPVGAIALNSCVLALLLAEAVFEPLLLINRQRQRMRHYWQIRWIAILQKPANLTGRIYFCTLFLALVAYVQYKMVLEANAYIQILVCWVLALVIGSYQFDNEAFYRKYHHYLAGLLNRPRSRYLQDMLPAVFMAFVAGLAMTSGLNFSGEMLVLLPLGVLLTVVGVTKFYRNFFILPSLFYALFLFRLKLA
ncbi:hypothetical protein SG34_029550 [Thalassomonas viridans]|uniref:Uncharacterized protein n=1 Tax=Thalassomonas viridans TaxID=137584 RepID=A0AAE9ZAE3_9GAMM|nr:DUF6136 family protein [Thalassomonas viridans]WDE08887.1 hypothetical protein SG34_033915 [Thalassomonas viridans]WDE08934.1 hypothetical protein SG34_029550 [Thalassomonas viridans]